MKFAFIKRYRSRRWTVVLMCGVLGVSKAGFYRWLSRRPSPQVTENERLLRFLLAEADRQAGVPGYRKLWQAAVNVGFACSQNRVQRLLQRAGYRSTRALRPGYRRPKPGLPALPNLLNREFDVTAPNRVWVSDITQVRCHEGWWYLAIVMDLYSRRIVGWAGGPLNDSHLVERALRMAWAARQPSSGGMLFHSDQGAQYRSENVMRWLTERGITLSMSRRGNCWDNACAESFFAQLKEEWLRRLARQSRAELQAEAEYYIEEYYDKVRLHGALGGVSPKAFEAAA
ncbi:mobile element protein [Halomonas beimenensis]|uniref:Mobile element protein n=1 Tax=Halomonas beimenensis TaxID=475662 RepID=A0A291P955_9GAMM|nr:mobile element protein [Halomonas beimenensis]ATJ83443.1 mobile element protein [Halomonas beimenensis]ATJ83809.1 mobile element protein [Halomonas beimenensis]ATJ83934.1 mobile element protein [Halomonas beimenensis]ATJ84308.1 mobile element protein [Halomonas beimenensis]